MANTISTLRTDLDTTATALRVLFVTNNSHLRSTSCSLDAVLNELTPRGLAPTMLFREPGPWQERLAELGVACHFDSLELPDLRRPIDSLVRIRKLVRLVRQNNIDLIHCNEHDYYALLRKVARWSRTPILVHIRFKIDQQFSDWAFRPPYLPDAVQFTSKALHEACRPYLPAGLDASRQKLVLNGRALDPLTTSAIDSDSARRAWGLAADSVLLGTASSIRPHKKLGDFIRVVALLRSQGRNVQGVIAGGPPFADEVYLRELQQEIQKQGLDPHIKMVGDLNPINPFLQAIDVFVSTSQWETFGMSICEAMACGKPAVAFEAGGVSEVIHNSSLVVAGRDCDTMAARLAPLVDDEAKRRELGAAAALHVRTLYDAAPHARRQAEIYEQVTQRTLGFCDGAPRA
jgi:glycosyltransferase involved in cell wall biosynthesis